MKAELLATASAVSFVLFLVAVGVWARSYWHPGISVTTSLPHHNGERVGRSIFGGLSCGKIGVGRVVTRHPEPSGEGDMDRILTTHDHLWRKAHSEYVVSIGRVSGGGILGRLGFGHGVDSDGDGETSPRHQHVWVHFPLLPLVVLAGLLPSVWAKRRWWPRGAGQKVAIRTAGETGPDGRLGEGGHGWDEGAIRTSLWTVVLVCSALLTLVLSMVWATSYFTSIGIFSLPFETTLSIHRGLMLWEHTYAWGATIPLEEYLATPFPPERIVPRPAPLLGFAYTSGHVKGVVRSPLTPESVTLSTYWLLATPMWLLLAVVGWPWGVFVLWCRANSRSSRLLAPTCEPIG